MPLFSATGESVLSWRVVSICFESWKKIEISVTFKIGEKRQCLGIFASICVYNNHIIAIKNMSCEKLQSFDGPGIL